MDNYLRKFAGTLIAILILALLLAYLFLFELKKPSKEESKEVVFADVKAEQIKEVNLKYPSHTVSCLKEGENWFVLKDSKRLKADDSIISEMITDMANMKIEKIISEKSTDLAGFGLAEPKADVIAKTPEKEFRLSIGGESPVGTGTYIKVNDEDKVLLVNKNSVAGFLDKSADDLRDKQILSIDDDKIYRVRFKWKDSWFELERTKGGWIGRDIPQYVEIDQARVWAILGTFTNLKVDSFEEDEPKDLSSYGLDNPSAEIEILGNDKPVLVLFGNKKREGVYYVKLASADPVYSLSEFVFRQVPETVNDIRARGIVKLDDEKVSGLEVKRGDTDVSILKQGNNWKLNGEQDKKVDESKVSELISEIQSIEVERFVDDNPSDLAPYGLDKPEIQITVAEGDKKTTIFLGKTENEKVYAKLADEKSVYALSNEILSYIPSSKDELIEK